MPCRAAAALAAVVLAGAVLPHAAPHPSTAPGLHALCNTTHPRFFSFHAHILFDDHNATSRTAALALQAQFARDFGISSEVDPVRCDDFNTTHGQNPGLCMIDADYGKPDFPHGHYGSPACPFERAEWAAFVPPERFQEVSLYLMQRRGELDLMLHPNSGCEVWDHEQWPLWGGVARPLNATCLHYDCPGCNLDDCRAFGRRTVLAGSASRACGLVQRGGLLEPSSEPRFCSAGCQEWVLHDLADWARSCPYNCDLFAANATEAAACLLHLRSAPELERLAAARC